MPRRRVQARRNPLLYIRPDPAPYKVLPDAKTVLITFPLKSADATKTLLSLYRSTHLTSAAKFIQLGFTSVWNHPGLSTRSTPIDPTNERGRAETQLLEVGGCVLNLSGLWSATRAPGNWVSRIAGTKDALAQKTSLHLVHGKDVAKAILAVHADFTPGERWLITDMRNFGMVHGSRSYAAG